MAARFAGGGGGGGLEFPPPPANHCSRPSRRPTASCPRCAKAHVMVDTSNALNPASPSTAARTPSAPNAAGAACLPTRAPRTNRRTASATYRQPAPPRDPTTPPSPRSCALARDHGECPRRAGDAAGGEGVGASARAATHVPKRCANRASRRPREFLSVDARGLGLVRDDAEHLGCDVWGDAAEAGVLERAEGSDGIARVRLGRCASRRRIPQPSSSTASPNPPRRDQPCRRATVHRRRWRSSPSRRHRRGGRDRGHRRSPWRRPRTRQSRRPSSAFACGANPPAPRAARRAPGENEPRVGWRAYAPYPSTRTRR